MRIAALVAASLLVVALVGCTASSPPSTARPGPATPTPGGIVLGGRALLQGRVNHAGIRVTVAGIGSTETSSDGAYALPGVALPGVYAMTVEMTGFLPAEGTLKVSQEAEAVVVPEITLLAGELTEDRGIDLYDLVTLGTMIGEETEGAARGDLNGDGDLSVKDLVLLANNLGAVGPIPVQ